MVVETGWMVTATGAATAAVEELPASATEQQQEEAQARFRARIQNRRVEIKGSRTEDSSTFANPDGSLTTEAFTGPVHVKDANGDWRKVDTTLEKVGNSIQPKAAAAGIRFSAGGNTPYLAQVEDAGHSFGVDWQGALPKPELDGDTATYRNVVPGGDLVVTALPTGFSHSVVLRERPKKALQFKLPVSADSLRLEETGDKRLRWENDKGKQVASAPVPLMWDSSQDKDSGEPEHAAQVTTQVQDTAGDEQTLVLSPDQDFLSDPDVEYPVVIDPTNTLMGPVTDTWVQYDDFPNSQRGSTELKAGTYDGTEKARSYLKFDVAQYVGKHITDTDLRLYSYWSSSCDTTGAGIEARRVTADWDPSAITWGAQPATTATSAIVNKAAKGHDANCPAGHVSWDIDGIVQSWADGQPNYGIRLAGADETDPLTWRRYRSANYVDGSHDAATEPSLTVTYNSYPSTPTATTVSPQKPGASSLTTASLTPTLSAKVGDADAGSSLRTQFEIAADPAFADTTYSYSGTSLAFAPGSEATLRVPTADKLPEGAHLRVRARTYDGVDYSKAWSAWVPFSVDTAGVLPGDAPTDFRTGGTGTLTPLLSGVVSTPSGGLVDADFTLADASGTALGGSVLGNHTAPSGDRTSFQVPAGLLTDGQTYTWKMRACHEGKCSAYSAAQSFKVALASEEAATEPQKLSITGAAVSSAQVVAGGEACDGLPCDATTGAQTLRVGREGTKTWRSYLKPDLSALPAGARVTSAVLRVTSTSCITACGDAQVGVYPLNEAFAITGHGMDLENAISPDALVTGGTPWEFDVTGLVAGWRDGAGAGPNHGVALLMENESATGPGIVFASPENTTAARRPVFDLTYIPATAPGAVTNASVQRGDTGLLATWSPVTDSGYNGSDVTYTVSALDGSGVVVKETTTTGTSAVLTGLANGTAYTVRIKATTAYGTGPAVTTGSMTPTAVPQGAAYYRETVQQYLAARDGITTGTYADSGAATAASSRGPSFSWLLSAEGADLVAARSALTADAMSYTSMTSQLTDVLALPSQDGLSVTLRATVKESSALYDGAETTPTESQQTWRYTFALADTPVLNRRVDAGQAELVMPADSSAFSMTDFGSQVSEEEAASAGSALPRGAVPSTGLTLSGAVASPAQETMATLNATGISNWARANWNSQHEVSQDCTNFTSKALNYGGKMRMKGVGKNEKSIHNWWRKFHYNDKWGGYWTWSHTWTVANKQVLFFLEHSNGKWLGENQAAAKKGDIVFFDWNGKGIYDHAGVITKVKNGKAYVTAHNRNRLDKPLNEYLTGSNKGTDYSIIRVKPNWY
jgi:hypothetical protein